MKTQTLSRTFNTNLEALQAALTQARDGLKTAGDLIIKMLEENEDAFEIILARCKGLTVRMLESLERIGRGTLEPLLLADPSPAAQRAIAQDLPMPEQKKLVNGFIPVAIRDGGGVKIEQRKLSELNLVEACRVIGDGKIRSADEQIQILKQEAENRAARQLRYEIREGEIIFHAETRYSWRELQELADKIKPQAKDIEAEVKRRQIN